MGNGGVMRKKADVVVVITGASAGVGRATAREFAARNARIGLIARGKERLESARIEVERAGGRGLPLSVDVTDEQALDEAATAVERELGPIDIWVNSAMTTIFSPFLEIALEEFARAMQVTFMGYVNGTRSALRRMVPRDRGTIVQVGSALSYRAIPLQSPYCAAKFAIRGFTDALRSELLGAKSHVHITMVQLPAVNTPQFSWCRAHLERRPRPVAPVFQPEVAARAIAWAADHRRREIDVGASSTLVILFNKMFPGLLDRYLVSTIEGQQRSEPLDPTRPDNLFSPVPGDFSAHGEFGSESRDSSPFFWATTHRKWIGTAAAGLALAGVCLLGNRSGRVLSAKSMASRIKQSWWFGKDGRQAESVSTLGERSQ